MSYSTRTSMKIWSIALHEGKSNAITTTNGGKKSNWILYPQKLSCSRYYICELHFFEDLTMNKNNTQNSYRRPLVVVFAKIFVIVFTIALYFFGLLVVSCFAFCLAYGIFWVFCFQCTCRSFSRQGCLQHSVKIRTHYIVSTACRGIQEHRTNIFHL